MREVTPEDTSTRPVSSRSAQVWSIPRGANRRERRRPKASRMPAWARMRRKTVKNRMKAQIFRPDWRAPVTELTKALEKRTV